jgi:glycosyltransferase involved in cell wall biosynthesis
MMRDGKPVRVLYSFPHKLGGDRICNTAWQHVNSLAAAGAEITVFPGVLSRPLPQNVSVFPTLARGRFRIPYKLLGRTGACTLHDWVVSRRLQKLAGQIDIVHTWPLGAIQTEVVARRLGIPVALERPNAHTAYAYEVVRLECRRLGITMPRGHEHEYNSRYLRKEEAEYDKADYLFCPSEFVARTFLQRGFSPEKLVRHQYGFDPELFHTDAGNDCRPNRPFTMVFVGGCAPRKGLHYALEAWLKSPASRDGLFLIAGGFIPGYAEKLASMLSHPSVKVLGHRKDVADLMRQSDVFVLPTIEEGSALVTYEARGCGCVLLVSEASGAICAHERDGLVHRIQDVQALTQHISMLYEDRGLLKRLRAESLKTINEITWKAAGVKLLLAYENILEERSRTLGKNSGLRACVQAVQA